MKRFVLMVLLATPLAGLAQALDNIASGAGADLQKSLTDLSAVRREVEAERIPLARQLTELEQQLTERKAALAKAQRFQENQLVELNALKSEARLRSEEVKYVDSLLSEYARAFRSRLNFVEEPRYVVMFDNVDRAAVAADLSPAEKFSQRSVLITTSLHRSQAALGGEIMDGRALDKQGRVQPGKVAVIGPVVMFASTSGEATGLLQQELNKPDPTIFQLDKKLDASSRALVTTGSGQLVLDATQGNAFKLAAMKKSFFQQLEEGGLAMIPLVVLGLMAMVLAILKWYQLSSIRLTSEADLQKVLQHLEDRQTDQALAHARTIPGMAGNLLATAVEHADEKKEYLEEILYEKMLGARIKLDRGLSFLALTATTGPLLGLLGTVMGMITTFTLISSFGSGDPKIMATGISEALICTAAGMAVAIPCLLFHSFLSRKAKGIIGSMEQTAVGFINGVPSEAKNAFATV